MTALLCLDDGEEKPREVCDVTRAAFQAERAFDSQD